MEWYKIIWAIIALVISNLATVYLLKGRKLKQEAETQKIKSETDSNEWDIQKKAFELYQKTVAESLSQINKRLEDKEEETPDCAALKAANCSGDTFVGSIVTAVALARASITAVNVPFSKSAAPFTVFTKLPIKSFLL